MRRETITTFSARPRRCVLMIALIAGAAATYPIAFSQTATAAPNVTGDDIATGSAALAKGDNAGAEKAFRRVLSVDPNSVPLLNNLALSVARQNRNDEAITLYLQALSLKPHDRVTERNLGVAYFRAHKYVEAEPILERIATSTPTFQSLELAGLDLFAMDRYQEAETYLERARVLEPDDLDNLNMLGQSYLRSSDYASMTEVFTHIMAIRPDSAEAHVMLATAYDKLFREEDAIREFREAERVEPNYPGVHTGLGIIYFRLDESDLAKREFLLALAQSRTDPVANCTMGRILRREGKVQEATGYFEAALTVNHEYVDALREIGESWIALKQPTKAVDFLRRAEALDPSDAGIHFILGTALRDTGHSLEGSEERAKAAKILSRNHTAGSSAP